MFIQLIAALFLFDTLYTAIATSLYVLPYTMAVSNKARSNIFIWKICFSVISLAFPLVVVPLIKPKPGEPATLFHTVVIALGVLAFLVIFFSTFFIKEKVSTLKTSSDMLKENMLNMIDWMKMEMDGSIGNKREFNVRTLVEESVESQWIDVSKKQLNIINEVEEGLVAHDDIDLARLVLRNLINNAVKFSSPEGTIRIWAEEEEGRIWVVVADQGKGMKGLSIRNLSNEPASPKARTQGEGGSGIGLALCKDLLELNGEKIDIKSEEDKGTTVRFSIKK
jgi:signal transduction histidine kinase